MSMSDPIADMLTRIRNANAVGHETVDCPHSRLKSEIARVLKEEGFILDYTSQSQERKKILRLYLKYGTDQEPVIKGLRRVSTPGCRRYVDSDTVPRVLGGLGLAIMSTSRGLLTDRQARTSRVGGEVMCHVW